jgi:glutathione S-transferase
MLKIYGSPQQRAFRALWMAEELSIPYERIQPDQRSPEFRKINPNGRVPAIQDGDVTLFESMAINLYLASKYGREKGLWPSSIEDQGRAYQWSFWAMTETDAPVLEFVIHRSLPAAQRNEARMKAAEDKLKAALPVLDGALQDRPYLLGSTFTVADLNVGSVLAPLLLPRVDLDASGFPRAWDWLARIATRPAVARARKS